MDFHTLSRRDLQALCKRNKIPANTTNLAMADALAALSQVEGLEELLNQSVSDTAESSVLKDLCVTPNISRTATRNSTRTKTAKEQEPESSVQSTRTRRTTRKTAAGKTAEENINVNVLETPAAPATRRRAQAASARTRQKAEIATEEVEKNEGDFCDVTETNAAPSRQKQAPAASTMQRMYSTRRSVRLLEKTMAELTLTKKEMEIMEPIKMGALGLKEEAKGIPDEVEKGENKDEAEAMTVAEGLDKIVSSDAYSDENSRGVPDIQMEVKGDMKEPTQEEAPEELLDEAKENEDTEAAAMSVAEGLDKIVGSDASSDENSWGVPDIKREMKGEMKEPTQEEATKELLDEATENEDTDEAGSEVLPTECCMESKGDSDPFLGTKPSGSPELQRELEYNMEEVAENINSSDASVLVECVLPGSDVKCCIEDENVLFGGTSEKAFTLENECMIGEGEEIEVADDMQTKPEAKHQVLDERSLGSFERIMEAEESESTDAELLGEGFVLNAGTDDCQLRDDPATRSLESLEGLTGEEESKFSEAKMVKEGLKWSAVGDDDTTLKHLAEESNGVEEIPQEDLGTLTSESMAAVINAPSSATPVSLKMLSKKELDAEDEDEITKKIQIYADWEAEEDVLPSLNTTPASIKKMISPYSSSKAKKSSSKKPSTLKDVTNLVNENKENIGESGRSKVESNAAVKGKKSKEMVVQDINLKSSLNEKSLRELTKMLKEKLTITSRSDGGVAKGQQQMGKIRQALETLPDNLQAVGETEEK